MAATLAGAAVTARQGGGSSSYGNARLGTANAGPAGARLLEAAEAARQWLRARAAVQGANKGSKLLGSRLW